MPDEERAPLTASLDQLEFFLKEPVDFTHTDTETTITKVRVLAAAAKYFNTLSVTEFGGRLGMVRAEGLVEQVVAAAFQSFGGEDPHPDPFDKAAMLLRGITQGHPFNDGNKRTGFLLAAYYLQLVGLPFPERLSVTETVGLCVRVSAGEIRDVREIARALRHLWGVPST